VFNGPEASKGAGLSCAARPAYPSVVQAVTIRLAVRQPEEGNRASSRGRNGRDRTGKDMIAGHSLALPQTAGHRGISRGLIRVVGYGS
jgi:hypothetical protein